jgi:hypothetical protein
MKRSRLGSVSALALVGALAAACGGGTATPGLRAANDVQSARMDETFAGKNRCNPKNHDRRSSWPDWMNRWRGELKRRVRRPSRVLQPRDLIAGRLEGSKRSRDPRPLVTPASITTKPQPAILDDRSSVDSLTDRELDIRRAEACARSRICTGSLPRRTPGSTPCMTNYPARFPKVPEPRASRPEC